MTRMVFEAHKSISAILLCCTLYTVLQNSGGLCEELLSQNKESDQQAPTKQHHFNRISRSTSSLHDSTSMGKEAGSGHLFPPLTLNKLQTRMSRFHGNAPPRFGVGQLAKMLVSRDTPGIEGQVQPHTDGENLGEQHPTFTPFISARALSNMPEFFDYLKANLAALKNDEGGEEDIDPEEFESGQVDEENFGLGFQDDNMNGGGIMPDIPNTYPEQKGIRWPPVSFGGGGTRPRNLRKFIQEPSIVENQYRYQSGYNPSRNVYEFGLG